MTDTAGRTLHPLLDRLAGTGITREDGARLTALLMAIDQCSQVLRRLEADPDIHVQAASGRSVWGHVVELYEDLTGSARCTTP